VNGWHVAWRSLRRWYDGFWHSVRNGRPERVVEGRGWQVEVVEGAPAGIPGWERVALEWDARSDLGSASLSAARSAGVALWRVLPARWPS
jgi:hypothetical protein